MLEKSEICFQRGPQTFIQRCQRGEEKIKTSRVEVRFIDESDFVNRGNVFILENCPHWELDSMILLELTDLLDAISVFRRN